MQYTDLNKIKRVVLGSLDSASGAGRSQDTIHLTDVLHFIQESMGTGYKGKGFNDIKLTWDVGFMWEKVAEDMVSDAEFSRHAWADRFKEAWKSLQSIRLGEIPYDGVACSPDGVGADPLGEHPIAVHEYKCTWKSSKNHPSENWYYMAQVKGYCKAIGTSCAVMQVLYLNGDYKGSGPSWLPVRFVFDASELEENWRMIKNNAEYMRDVKNGKHGKH
jgi:hypothetical protein